MPDSNRQLVAIMFTDIVGYTTLMGDEEEKAIRLLEKNRKLQKPLIDRYGGKWIKEMGDGVLATFSTVSDAVYCAAAIQKASKNDPDLSLRIGIHLGEVVVRETDIFGDGVNIASRLESIAPPGKIWVSETVTRNIQNKQRIETVFVREETLKNVKDPVRIYEIVVEDSEFPEMPKNTRPTSGTKSSSLRKGSLALVVIVIAILVYFGYIKLFDTPAAEVDEASIAVLAFADMSPNKDQEYFSDGISEELLGLLSKIPELRVISRTSSFSYKGKDMTAKEIGKELQVRYLLEGSIRKSENKVRIGVQLIKSADGSEIWSETYDRELDDIFNIQYEISAAVSRSLEVAILGKQSAVKAVDTEAYTLYLRALHLLHQNTRQSYINAEKIVKESLEIDDSYAPSWDLLATIYHTGSYNFSILPTAEAADLGIEAAKKAIALDSTFAGAYATLSSLYEDAWQFEKAEKSMLKALDLEPNNSVIIGTAALSSTISLEESILLIKKAIKLDPNIYVHYYNLGYRNFLAGRLDEAEEALTTFAIYYPNSQIYHYVNSRILVARGKPEQALMELEMETHPFFLLYGLNFATFAAGKIDQADSLFNELIDRYGETDPANIADMYAFRGEVENSFLWLRKAIDIQDPVLIEAIDYPTFKILYSDPRWTALVDQIGIRREYSLDKVGL